jgi:predicted transcriptional regulator
MAQIPAEERVGICRRNRRVRGVIGRLIRHLFKPRSAAGLHRRPAVPVEQSVTPYFLICLETGSRQVLLRRHLLQQLSMTPEEYRARWNLPKDYPMIAPRYSDARKAATLGPDRARGC